MAEKLPNELVRCIVDHYVASKWEPDPDPLTPLAMVNRQWLANVEPIIWGEIRIDISKFKDFKKMFSRSSRRRALTDLTICSNGWFCTKFQPGCDVLDGSCSEGSSPSDEYGRDENEIDEDESSDGSSDHHTEDGWPPWDDGNLAEDYEDSEERAADVEAELSYYFQEMYEFWEEMSGWGDDLKVKRLCMKSCGLSFFEHLGRGFRAAPAVLKYLAVGKWLENLPSMPKLPSVVALRDSSYLDGFWHAILLCRLSKSLPHLETLILEPLDFGKTWYYARKYMREGYLAFFL